MEVKTGKGASLFIIIIIIVVVVIKLLGVLCTVQHLGGYFVGAIYIVGITSVSFDIAVMTMTVIIKLLGGQWCRA